MQLVSKKNTLLTLAAVLVVALGFMALKLSKPLQKRAPKVPQYETEINNIENQSASDDLNSIEADVNATELDNLDREMYDIESELEGSL